MEIDAYMLVIMENHGMSKLGEASEKLTQLVLLHVRTPWPREGYRASKWGSKNQTKAGIPAPPPPWFPASLGQS